MWGNEDVPSTAHWFNITQLREDFERSGYLGILINAEKRRLDEGGDANVQMWILGGYAVRQDEE
jgi:hypothetical protein